MFKLSLALVATLAVAGTANAAALTERNMPLALATGLAQASLDACAAEGHNVSVAVVDRAGNLRALMRADAAGPHTLDSAQRKAYTAASTRTPTSVMADNIAKNPSAAQLVSLEGFLVLAGGVPVKVGDETIGAIGIGGAPAGAIDEACAVAAIEQLGAELN